MPTKDILLINTNVARPPVSPVGLEYLGEALIEAGVSVRVIDLSFERDWAAALRKELRNIEPLVVGLTVRNTDDCSFASKKSFLPWICDVVSELKKLTTTRIVLGGVGFSVMPEMILRMTGADFGIVGDGEDAMLALVHCFMQKEDVSSVPNLVYWYEGNTIRNPVANVDLSLLPVPRRRLFDNKKYEELGAMVGIETKRGCSQRCVFCADPVAKGNRIRLRPPSMVVQEFQNLLNQGVSWLHFCDSEFNLPIDHAKEICQAIIEAKLGDKLRWYTYCCPIPFDMELADLMKHAGCCGVNFGVDSLCGEQLRRLGRSHSEADVQRLVQILQEQGLNYMFDLLVGGPDETEDTIAMTSERIKQLSVPLVGIAAGVRIYPGTSLSDSVIGGDKRGLHPQDGNVAYDPVFYLSPRLGDDVSVLISRLTAGDSRFMFLSSPEEQGSYNYADAEDLCKMIQEGARGAYWDIISRTQP
jgi:radical SAM superfamily enzyme YgiQ (UPF0313 family)